MPAQKAYSPAKVIATGLMLQQSGPVSPRSLHKALGGGGLRTTAAEVWEEFEELQQKFTPSNVPEAPNDLPPEASQAIASMVETFTACVRKAQQDAIATADRRVGHYVHQLDGLLAAKDRLEHEADDLAARLDAAGRDIALKDSLIAELREEVGQLRLQVALAKASR